MRKSKLIVAGAALAMAIGIGPAKAGLDLNEVSAFLVYPGVAALYYAAPGSTAPGLEVETFLTVTNTSSNPIIAHVSFINGNQWDPRYCYECDFDVPMSGLDTETLVLRVDPTTGVTLIENLDTGARRSCSQKVGFVTIDVEDFDHNVLTDNILLGSEVVVDYTNGAVASIPAIAVQGESGNGDRLFTFDDVEYRKFPAVIGADFLAPDFDGPLSAWLVLFTLAFDRQFPPLTDCSVIGFDAFEAQFSNSFQFGCWTIENLAHIDPEFSYPFLGDVFDYQEHGWFQLTCTVFGTGDNGVVDGGVHGAIAQYAQSGAVLRREDAGPALGGAAAWSRILFQSGTVGDAMSLRTESPARGGTF
jgi:hypothetical protein